MRNLFIPRHCLLFLSLLVVCCRSNPKNSDWVQDPFVCWVPYEKAVFPKELLPSWWGGYGVGFDHPTFVRYNKKQLILLDENKWTFQLDISTKKWELLIAHDEIGLIRLYPNFVNNPDPVLEAEFNQKLAILEAQYEADVNRIFNSLFKFKEQLYTSFPERWITERDPNGPAGQDPPAPPVEAKWFSYMDDAHYESWEERWRGGWWGGEHSRAKYTGFVGTRRFTFQGKPIFEDADGLLPSCTFVTKDFRTVFYFRRSPALEFYIMDLTDLWKEADHAAAVDRPAGKP